MKRTTMLLAIGALILLVSGMGAVNAETNENANAWYGPMYNWMADHMGSYGYGPGACWGGYGSSYAYADTTQEIAVPTVEDAYDIAKTKISADVSMDNIYQMSRWWVVYYTDADGAIKQGRIDSFTGEVVQDFNTYSNTYARNYQSGTSSRNYRGGMGTGMMYGY
ncbi:hypothetical protein RE476_04740 [Methanolobus mangrovi]|uniref:PepSY domain-containing protein n=1 Tax=Methanolobus mangrovi TaxID=3072977 RepID=A0AA51UHB1_9EURY|nr:hypothetical protein [Methanolobus mangrovi]WMW23140.1 hypothetical protein RE476_04740 [Methanolobus mangrovi]